MATKLKVVEDLADIVPAPTPPGVDQSAVGQFAPALTRKSRAGWSAERQRTFIEQLALTGCVGDAAALVGLSSSSAYRLRNRAGSESFARAWDCALGLACTRLTAVVFDRALHGRSERIYKDGELVAERKVPSDYLLTWLLSRLDPLQFGSPTAKALAAATGDPRELARNQLPTHVAELSDIAEEDCKAEAPEAFDSRLGEMQ